MSLKKQGLKTFSILLHNDFKKDRIVHQQQQQNHYQQLQDYLYYAI